VAGESPAHHAAFHTDPGLLAEHGPFSIINQQAIRRGSFTSVADLIAAIEAFIDGRNDRRNLFAWTKTADERLPKCRPGKRALFTRH
jgi:hypothetical protein